VKSKAPFFRVKLMPLVVMAAFCLTSASLMIGHSVAQNLPTLGDTAREDLSPLMERKLGEQIMQSVRRDPDYVDDGPISEYLNKLGGNLLEKRPDARGEAAYDFQFFAVRDPVLNAFAFPGGFIGFHSGLLLAAQSESELASVMGHEIGHVSQRHIARMIGSQKQDVLIPLAALVLAALAAKSSPDAAMALVMGGQGLSIQRQINFTRESEREADRVGFQILRDGGYDPAGMVTFFGRLQYASRNYTDSGLAYLRSHPLSGERMADIQGRMLDQRYKQRVDGLDFYLMQARVRVLQDSNAQGLMDATTYFQTQIKTAQEEGVLSAEYGLAFVAFKQHDYERALKLLNQLIKKIQQSATQQKWLTQTSAFASLAIDIHIANKRTDTAIAVAEKALQDLPLARGIAVQYAEALIVGNRTEEAAAFLRDQVSLYRREAALQILLAKAYEAQGKVALQHIALAEGYAIDGALLAALQQLEIARRDPDVQFYDLAVIDAREREWQEKHKEELLSEKKKR
jgi:predicted Zn-dependent protease